MFRKQAACKHTVSQTTLLGKLLVQRWRGSSGNVQLTLLLTSYGRNDVFLTVFAVLSCIFNICRTSYEQLLSLSCSTGSRPQSAI